MTIEKKVEKITHEKSGLATVDYEWIQEGKELKFSWVTDLKLNKKNVFSIVQAGRKRWAIELIL